MSLNMTRPYAHPKTGTYWVRKVVPEALRARVGKRELVRSLGTKDPREARRKAPTVLAEFDPALSDISPGVVPAGTEGSLFPPPLPRPYVATAPAR